VRSECATPAEIEAFYSHDYVAALRRVERAGVATAHDRERHGIGTMENPVYPGLFTRAATTVGGSIRAGELASEGRHVFHPAGGTHHGQPDRASGFCYFNDPVFAILALLKNGKERVVYVDLDAHHGDGVQNAFKHNQAVWTVSLHEEGRWPHTGARDDVGGGRSLNLPVPAELNDTEFLYLMSEAALPYIDAVRPDATVIVCGADALAGDPLSHLSLSNAAVWTGVETILARTPAAVVLGGGGYNPWTLARCWTGLWGRMCGVREMPLLPERGCDLLASLRCDLVDEEDIKPEWLTTLADKPQEGPVRDAVRRLVDQPYVVS